MDDGVFQFTPEAALELWYEAIRHEFGIKVEIHNPTDIIFIVNRMYEARKDINDEKLSDCSLHVAADGRLLYVYKRAQDLED